MFDFGDIFTAAGLAVLGQVIMIDLTLAGDNVVVLGSLAAGLPPAERKKVLGIGVGIALVFLIGFALVATQLLHVIGLLFAGGLLLLWVAWKLFRELHPAPAPAPVDDPTTPEIEGPRASRSFGRAILSVTLADLSMSLDNVLAVAGTAREHPAVLFVGLAFSVTLMAVAANFVARIIERYHWIIYIGLAVILYVAGRMIYDGIVDPQVGLMVLMR
ncbi:YjbE family putative metal transport protein [Stakelama saccharophila]|uniref:YjbE family putative metal transport protein n=1 Tax=Stakelama saccharophila TaxID=3075605 RepID=A0ABZ0B9C1_9SPHN|nr:YjbE family putative metal transport protein [Stakelama sp. W311]WNO54005.1 YjbE family putative metal transport protein [Stakelama sp. W311]